MKLELVEQHRPEKRSTRKEWKEKTSKTARER